MAGGVKLYSLVLLMALLALFTTTHAARSHLTMQSLNRELVSAFGVSQESEPCCLCFCDRRSPEFSECVCGGAWEGGCPSVCKKCTLDDTINMYYCLDGSTIKYNDCMSNSCPDNGADKGVHKGI